MSHEKEKELVIFAMINRHSLMNLLNSPVYEDIEQCEVNSLNKKGVRITTRSRKINRPSEIIPEYNVAIKYRDNRKKSSSVSSAIEIESIANELQHEALKDYSDTIHLKRRVKIEIKPTSLVAEIDLYKRPTTESFDMFVKVDIEGAEDKDYDTVIRGLSHQGINFIGIKNPPGVFNKEIGDTISVYMQNYWNHAK